MMLSPASAIIYRGYILVNEPCLKITTYNIKISVK